MNFHHYVPEPAWDELLRGGTRRSYSPSAPLMQQGQTSDSVVVLIQGTVKVTESSRAGQVVPLALRGPGELLGEVGVLLNQPRSASVWAVNRCVGHSIPASTFRSLVERKQLTGALHRFALNRSLEKEAHLRSLRCDPTEIRMARFLTHLALEVGERNGQSVTIQLGMDRAELGLMLRMSRATAIETLGQLKALGLIKCGRKHIEVADIEALGLYTSQEMRNVI
ncbi:Crp/Fnr family transcriptional regulator [Nocardiopsis eucommiae]|uniref:Crp/Fnr family transcriptional regulator n=2 Tax=Actinomycetes TaxID=1760 RepID=UPI003D75355B